MHGTRCKRLVSKGWLLEFETLEDITEFLGEALVLSKCGLVVETKGDLIKRRLILDAKASGTSGVASKLERILLPRVLGRRTECSSTSGTGARRCGNSSSQIFVTLSGCSHQHFASESGSPAGSAANIKVSCENAQGSRNAPWDGEG